MWRLLRTLQEPDWRIRYLRGVRIMSFFYFFLLENIILVLSKLEIMDPREEFMRILKQVCFAFWCVSISLGVILDTMLHRGSFPGYLKALMDFPMAVSFTLRLRVHDGLLGVLGVSSSLCGIAIFKRQALL